jgi:folate-binding protein YgfZ
VTGTTDIGKLQHGAVWVDGGRQLVVATGADRSRFLHGIVTADVAGTAVGHGCRSALLTTKGHVVADMHLFMGADAIWVIVDPGHAATVGDMLSRYAIMDDFAAAPHADFALASLLGPEAAARLQVIGVDAGALAGEPPLSHAQAGELWLARVRELGSDGFWLGGSAAALAAARARLAEAGVSALAPAAAEAARIAALEPRTGAEITPDYFPMEVGLSGAIAYGKGCYLGQEPIVRIRDRGHINWRLCGLDVDGDVDPVAGDVLESDTKPKAGRVTSAARLPDGRAVALATVHTSVPVGATIRIKHGDASLPARVRAEAAN